MGRGGAARKLGGGTTGATTSPLAAARLARTTPSNIARLYSIWRHVRARVSSALGCDDGIQLSGVGWVGWHGVVDDERRRARKWKPHETGTKDKKDKKDKKLHRPSRIRA